MTRPHPPVSSASPPPGPARERGAPRWGDRDQDPNKRPESRRPRSHGSPTRPPRPPATPHRARDAGRERPAGRKSAKERSGVRRLCQCACARPHTAAGRTVRPWGLRRFATRTEGRELQASFGLDGAKGRAR